MALSFFCVFVDWLVWGASYPLPTATEPAACHWEKSAFCFHPLTSLLVLVLVLVLLVLVVLLVLLVVVLRLVLVLLLVR